MRRALSLLATAALVVTLSPATAQADPALTTTSTVTTKALPNGSTALEGLSVTDSNAEDVLQVTVSTDTGDALDGSGPRGADPRLRQQLDR